ncbi:MAG: glutamine synthetase [Rhodobiaceae bacterium]|nr:glutamine synthetase [Rhodobiaceae bacterium]
MTIPPAPLVRSVPEDVSAFLAEHPDLDTLEVVLPDINSVLRGKWMPGAAVTKVFESGVAFPFSLFGLDVWGREVEETGLHIETGDKDGVCWPVDGSLTMVPYAERKTAQLLLSMAAPDGTPFEIDPRVALTRIVDRLADMGLTANAAFELEFYLFEDPGRAGEEPKPVFWTERGPSRQNMYALSDLESLTPLIDELRRSAEAQGIAADAAVSEAAPGQFELNLHYRDDPLRAADDAVLLRRLVTGVARRHGLTASFMAKPFAEWPGNGMHVHVSFVGKDGNIFAGDDGETRLGHAVNGLLETMPDALLLFISTFNGFRRLQPGSYAPTSVCWGYDNRSVAVRIPAASEQARRIEHRIAGADANPYLVLIGVLAGMMHGLDKKKAPPPPVAGNAYDRNMKVLSPWMDEVIDAFEVSDFMKEAAGGELHRVLTAIKREELAAFGREISALERETYL